jgi:hypothetical protein
MLGRIPVEVQIEKRAHVKRKKERFRMRSSRPVAHALCVAAAAVLSACSGGAPQSSGLTPSAGTHGPSYPRHRLSDTFAGVKMVGAVRPDHHKSWVSPDVLRAPRLFFASDSGTNDVYVYTMPAMALKGTLTGFSQPQGECADKAGNIWVTNTNAFQVVELSRSGSVMNTISDSYGYPIGCAIDPTNGAIAVADIVSKGSGAGQVLVYATPSSKPTVLTNPKQHYYYFVGYDPGGDLWVSGRTSKKAYILSGCGASSCGTIPLSGGTIYFPGAVMWDNVAGTWVVFDQSCGGTSAACSYTVNGSGALGTPVTYLNYDGVAVCDLIQATIAAYGQKYVAGGDYEYCGGAASGFNRWSYPAGGTPTNYNASSALLPTGSAISTK